MGQDSAGMSSPEPDEDIRDTHRESAVTEQRSGPTLDIMALLPCMEGQRRKTDFNQ